MRCILCLLLFVISRSESIERSKGALGSKIFTFVHGDDAKMDFFSADSYCKKDGGQGDEIGRVLLQADEPEVLIESFNLHSQNRSAKARLQLRTRLASLHSFPENVAIVRWVSKQEKRAFWIGGQVAKTLNEYMRPIYVLQWTDGSTGDFSFLRLPSDALNEMSIGEQLCISVDYISGHWGVHSCEEKKFFVCLTTTVVEDVGPPTVPEAYEHSPKSIRNFLVGSEGQPETSQHQMTAEELRKLLS